MAGDPGCQHDFFKRMNFPCKECAHFPKTRIPTIYLHPKTPKRDWMKIITEGSVVMKRSSDRGHAKAVTALNATLCGQAKANSLATTRSANYVQRLHYSPPST